MSYLLLFFSSIISLSSFSQNLRIEYKYEHVGEKFILPFSANGVSQTYNVELPKLRMFINDTIAQIHYFKNGYDPVKRKTKEIGDKLIHHGYFYDFKNRKYYSQCNLDKTLKYLVPIDTTEFKSWNFFPDQKAILGYKCKVAISVNDKNDSTLVWFTNELQCNNGFLFYYGIPGLVLEAYRQYENMTVHYLAVKIEETDIELLRPEEGNIISRKDFESVMKARIEKMGGNNFIKVQTIRTY